MFKIFFALVAVTTLVSMGVVGKIGSQGQGSASVKPAAMTISADGALAFPGRVPAPETVYKLRRAIQLEDVETLNALLVKNRLFVAPSASK